MEPIRTLAILQARTSSTRLPGKVLKEVQGKPMLLHQIDRVRRSRLIDELIVATSIDPEDDRLAEILAASGTRVHRGSLDDVLDRFHGAAQLTPSRHVVRLTGDCPLADADVIDALVALHMVMGNDVTTNSVKPVFPDGLDVEVVTRTALDAAQAEAQAQVEREHVTQFFYRRPERFSIFHFTAPFDLSALRWTVDEPEDFTFVREVFDALYPDSPDFRWRDVLALLERRPELAALNTNFVRNEGLLRSIAAEARAQQGE